MQSIRLCLGEHAKLSEETQLALEKVREAFLNMSRLPVQFGDLRVDGLLHSFTFVNESGRVYLECEFLTKEEGA